MRDVASEDQFCPGLVGFVFRGDINPHCAPQRKSAPERVFEYCISGATHPRYAHVAFFDFLIALLFSLCINASLAVLTALSGLTRL